MATPMTPSRCWSTFWMLDSSFCQRAFCLPAEGRVVWARQVETRTARKMTCFTGRSPEGGILAFAGACRGPINLGRRTAEGGCPYMVSCRGEAASSLNSKRQGSLSGLLTGGGLTSFGFCFELGCGDVVLGHAHYEIRQEDSGNDSQVRVDEEFAGSHSPVKRAVLEKVGELRLFVGDREYTTQYKHKRNGEKRDVDSRERACFLISSPINGGKENLVGDDQERG